MNFSISVDGTEKASRGFKNLSSLVRDFRPVWPEIHMYFLRATLEEFDAQGARGGTTWKALSPRYKAWKEKKYPGKPILVLTERLRRSFSVAGRKGVDQIYEENPLSLTMGTAIYYARYHQRGTKRMAARPIIQPTTKDMDRIVSRLYRFIERGARDAGFNPQTGRR